MKVNIRIAIFSHLSDAQELIGLGCKEKAVEEINYAKRLIRHYSKDLDSEADEDELTNVCLGK